MSASGHKRIPFTTDFTRNAIIHNGVLDHGVALITKPFTRDVPAHKLKAAFESARDLSAEVRSV